MEREILTELEIPAPVERVWQVLTDSAAFPRWNPVVRRLRHRGPLLAGAPALLTIELLPGRPPLVIPIRIRCVDHHRELSWEGGAGPLIRGVHYFRVARLAADRTCFSHGERFSGPLVPLLWPALEPVLRRSYSAFNEALAARVAATAP